jgi:hypothetical protein
VGGSVDYDNAVNGREVFTLIEDICRRRIVVLTRFPEPARLA